MYVPLLFPSSESVMLVVNFKSVWNSSKSRNRYLCGCTKTEAHVQAPLAGVKTNVYKVSDSTETQCSPGTISIGLL